MNDRLHWAPARHDDGPLRILFCANPSYFQHVAVAAVSVAENNRHSKLDVHLLTCNRDPAAEDMLRASLLGYDGLTLTTHHVPAARLERLFVDQHLTKECYLRLLAPEVLPAEIDRIIYLDCDVVVLDDLRPLWDIELEQNVLAAAPDYPCVPLVVASRAATGLPEDRTYVNSGVLLLNVERWRREKLTQRLFEYLERQGSALKLYDQDAINAVLHDAIRVVDCRWNLQARMYRSGRKSFPMEFAATREARRRPAIIHFTGSTKPWMFRSRTARKKDYFRYLDKTAWRAAQPPLTSAAQRLEYRIDRLLSRAGIDYLQVLYKLHRAPAKLGIFFTVLTRHSLRSMTMIVGKAASVRGTDR